MKLNLEQLSYLKGLNSKKKQRKFLLDCLVDNLIGESRKSVKIRDLPVIEKREFDESDYIDNENHLCWIFNRLIGYGENPNFDYMIKLKEIALNYSESKRENFKNDHENLLSKIEETSNEVLLLKSANLSIDQISAVVNWMNGYEQLKDTVIPIRFREDAVSDKDKMVEFRFYPEEENTVKVGWKKNRIYGNFLGWWDGKKYTYGFGYDGNWYQDVSNFCYRLDDEHASLMEVKDKLIKKLEADGLKVGCKVKCVDSFDFYVGENWENHFRYIVELDKLNLGNYCVYSNGKFAKIIPQEKEETKDPSKEYLNQSNIFSQIYNKMIFHNEDENSEIMQELKRLSNNEILVVDFENISESIPK